MQKQVLLMLCLMMGNTFLKAQETIHTSGKYLLGPCGDTLTLRGVNYAVYNWGYSPNDIKFDQIALSGANAVRIVWYHNNPDNTTLYSNTVALDSALSQCVRYQLIPILEMHDYTCANNASNLLQVLDWWSDAAVLSVLQKYKHSLIVNLANEALYVNWSGNFTAALNTYQNTYESIVSSLRAINGFDFPIMIDAPDCGQSSNVFQASNTAQNLIAADPQHKLIFSAHAYWYGYAANDSTQMAAKINEVLAANIPFVLGEIANQQDDANPCVYDLNYQALLKHCQQQNVSWLAWLWDHDICAQRQITTNGNINSLTSYGQDVIYNNQYGLAQAQAKSQYLLNQACGQAELAETNNKQLQLYPNPASESLQLTHLKEPVSYRILDAQGRCQQQGTTHGEIKLNQLQQGIYWLYIQGKAYPLIVQ